MATGDFERLMKQGYQLMEEGEYSQALSKFDKAIKTEPTNPSAYLAKADAAVLVPKVSQEEVIALYKKASELDPENPFIFQSWGAFYMDIGLFNDAETCYNRAAQVDPENAIYYFSEFGVEYYKRALVVYEQRLDEQTKAIIAKKALKYMLRSIDLDEGSAKKLL
jgi:tetratricopeptide (TPR) repeat protein